MNELRILVTGAGGPGAVNLSRALLSIRPQPYLVAADASPHYLYLALAHERALVPRCSPGVVGVTPPYSDPGVVGGTPPYSDPGVVGGTPPYSDVDAYLDAIEDLVSQHRIDFVMPNNSIEIALLSAERDRLSAPVFLPAPRALALADDKWASHQRWRDAGLPVPETRVLDDPASVRQAFAELQEGPDAPVWVRGSGIPGKGIGVASLPARTPEQAIQWVEYWRGWGGMTASEYLPGDNLSWLAVFDRGRLVVSQGKRRVAYVIPHVSPSGITGAPAICHTIHDSEVNRLGEAAALALDPGFHGVCFVDMKADADSAPRITELNAGRFGTTSAFFYAAAGANFPEVVLRLVFDRPVELPRRDVLPPDLYWIRTLDCGPVLTTGEAIRQGHIPSFDAESGSPRWPRVPQAMHDFECDGGDLPPRLWPDP